MIEMLENKSSLQRKLQIKQHTHRLITVVGAGGKTTLIYSLALEFAEQGLKAAVTTTTHMFREGRFGFTPIGAGYEGEKIVGLSPEMPRKLLEVYDVVLVEADGSKHLPLKVPAEHEPVLPEGADLVIGVAGAAAVGQTFREACHRAELACVSLGCEAEERITEEHLMRILTGAFGQKKGVACEYRYVINLWNCPSEKVEQELGECMKRYEEIGAMLSLDPELRSKKG